ncbi:aromatic ring-hydroxylating dioxygenase subunit alpha [Phenylobacterium sp.]|jgi:phenylpropionate dioxygenase-like ring-hydroxylating dioxygenase large terminal subunit|uniref:aromatic ring-hydroxylating dioxygenase subunit alpha n=1 Tax=Phenylobacterium sp. TaxID=1871053 RepID=UPI0037CA41B1
MAVTETTALGISAEAAARARLPLERAWTLPPAAYVSETVYALELERILRRSWIPLARLDQIPEPGDYLSLDLAGQPVMVVHGTDGEVRVLSRVCRHRAADIAPVSGRRKLFTCPYHAWAYDTSGRLVRAPLMESAEALEEADCALPQIRTEIWEGFVLANLDPGAAPLAPQIETYARYFANFKLADLEVVRTLTWESDWNWKVLVENFMEAYHHTGTHAQSLEPDFHAADSSVPDSDGPWSILHMPAAAHHQTTSPELIPGLTESQRRDIVAAVVFPHFMLLTFSGGVAWYQVTPHGAGRLTLNIHLCLPRSSRDLPAREAIIEGSAAAFAHIHAEDIEANDLVWRGLNAPLTQQGRLSPLERSIWQLNQLWLDRMGA